MPFVADDELSGVQMIVDEMRMDGGTWLRFGQPLRLGEMRRAS